MDARGGCAQRGAAAAASEQSHGAPAPALTRCPCPADPAGPAFERAIRQELQKVSAFYVEKEEELGAVMARLCRSSPEAIAAFRSEVTHLRKYQVG